MAWDMIIDLKKMPSIVEQVDFVTLVILTAALEDVVGNILDEIGVDNPIGPRGEDEKLKDANPEELKEWCITLARLLQPRYPNSLKIMIGD